MASPPMAQRRRRKSTRTRCGGLDLTPDATGRDRTRLYASGKMPAWARTSMEKNEKKKEESSAGDAIRPLHLHRHHVRPTSGAIHRHDS